MYVQKSFDQDSQGTLYLVPTPIGNLEDMTFRAINTLKMVDLIAAEDTRHTQQLLNYFEIKTHQISFHEHNTQERIPELIAKLLAGENIAQVSDAGMPSISDPGSELVQAAIENAIKVVPLPGANAGLTALIASGLVPQPFYFYGFLGRKKSDQKKIITELGRRQETVILYESPYRIRKTLKLMEELLGSERQVVLAREVTKRYEEFVRGSMQEVIDWFTEHEPRGEFVMLLAGAEDELGQVSENKNSALSITDNVQLLIASGMKPNAAIKSVAKERQLKKQDVYNIFHEIDDDKGADE